MQVLFVSGLYRMGKGKSVHFCYDRFQLLPVAMSYECMRPRCSFCCAGFDSMKGQNFHFVSGHMFASGANFTCELVLCPSEAGLAARTDGRVRVCITIHVHS